ncbi:hypothetical protein [Herminiimonas sp. CN]|uniref:hypothetical protein n=1 Tax=Herminiimonas sp. CN TaxID=1349818 RepID=UPI00047338F2|nr:hypothetical protein [Herminiimonas sp. CN]
MNRQPQAALVRVTLVTGASAAAREQAIARAIRAAAPAPNGSIALILEGLPGGLSQQTVALDPQHNPVLGQTARIAPGCMCCVGNLTLKVTLNRILRRAPQCLYISLAGAAHIGQLRAFLSRPPYDVLLRLGDDLAAA